MATQSKAIKPRPSSYQIVKAKALKLDLKNRARLAEQLLRTLEQPSKLELAELWTDEAIRRDDEMEQGIEKGRPAREVFRELRARVR